MKFIRLFIKFLFTLILLPLLYFVISLILSSITVNRHSNENSNLQTIYISTNGVHLDIIMAVEDLSPKILKGLKNSNKDQFLSFGWGDEDFYINTPEWSDLTISTAINALFFNSPTLLHITRHELKQRDWVEVNLTKDELEKMNEFLFQSFQTDEENNKFILEGKGYTKFDDFYKANGNYTIFNTCNTWVNNGFKESGLKACLWTPFDFMLINKYK